MMAGMTIIVRTVVRLLFPFTLLFGVYVIAHGHLTPGGGFPGGVIIALSFLMLILAYGIEAAKAKLGSLTVEIAESLGALMIVGLGMIGLVIGAAFLQNVLPHGSPGSLLSAGILPLLYLAVGIEVSAGIITIFYSILRRHEEGK
jgi:multicomponent Na+:H+ antiporter subunit B